MERALKDSIQKPNESCTSFIARYSRLSALSDPTVSSAKLIKAIRIRLRPEIVRMLPSHRLTSLRELNMAYANIEDGFKATDAAERLRKSTSTEPSSSKKNKDSSGKTGARNIGRKGAPATGVVVPTMSKVTVLLPQGRTALNLKTRLQPIHRLRKIIQSQRLMQLRTMLPKRQYPISLSRSVVPSLSLTVLNR